jgi:hypothetical protein
MKSLNLEILKKYDEISQKKETESIAPTMKSETIEINNPLDLNMSLVVTENFEMPQAIV